MPAFLKSSQLTTLYLIFNYFLKPSLSIIERYLSTYWFSRYWRSLFLLDDFLINNEKVSSTKLRYYLSSGEIDKANNLLGRDYCLTGKVKKGKQLGSELGFPTANLLLDEEVFLPTYGVYYGIVEVDKKSFNCISNIGLNPTVEDEHGVKIEAHIFNFNDDIYQKEISLFLKHFIRNEQKFENIDELKNQIIEDIESAKKYY